MAKSKIQACEMKVLRLKIGKMRLDRIRNDNVKIELGDGKHIGI